MGNQEGNPNRPTSHDVKESPDPKTGGKNYDAPDPRKLPPTEKQPEVRGTGDPGTKK
jgi:hypothetical protein